MKGTSSGFAATRGRTSLRGRERRSTTTATPDAIGQFLDHETGEPFDLAVAHCRRAQMVREAPICIVLILTAHHLICDGWSSSVLFSDLAAAMQQIVLGCRLGCRSR